MLEIGIGLLFLILSVGCYISGYITGYDRGRNDEYDDLYEERRDFENKHKD